MGWAFGIGTDGREIGYGVEAACEADGCGARIDRGLAHACGDRHGAGDGYCDGYFCSAHLAYRVVEGDDGKPLLIAPPLCPSCIEADDVEDGGDRG